MGDKDGACAGGSERENIAPQKIWYKEFSLLSPSALTLQFRKFLLPVYLSVSVSVSVRLIRTNNTSDWWSPPPTQSSLKCNWIQTLTHTFTLNRNVDISSIPNVHIHTYLHARSNSNIFDSPSSCVKSAQHTCVSPHLTVAKEGRATNYEHSVSTRTAHQFKLRLLSHINFIL